MRVSLPSVVHQSYVSIMFDMAFQEQPQQPAPAPNFDVHIDLSGLAGLIWQTFTEQAGNMGTALWPQVARWLEDGLRQSAEATWNGIFGAMPLLLSQMPADLTYNLPASRAIAIDPFAVAAGGATLALVLLGLRTMLGSLVGHDHLVVHVTGRLIPAVFLTLAYPVAVTRGLDLVNRAAASVGPQALSGMLAFPSAPNASLVLPYAVLWLVVVFFAIRLFIRLAYGLVRFLVALVFAPVALILWAIPQTEWVTSLWLRELVGWGTTPLLVVVSLALALPLVAGQAGFLAAAVLGIAAMMAAHDLVGLLGGGRGERPRYPPVSARRSVRLPLRSHGRTAIWVQRSAVGSPHWQTSSRWRVWASRRSAWLVSGWG
jgi:hypothetical protein